MKSSEAAKAVLSRISEQVRLDVQAEAMDMSTAMEDVGGQGVFSSLLELRLGNLGGQVFPALVLLGDAQPDPLSETPEPK